MNHTLENPYSDNEFPWNFYFNGVHMPKWGGCWGLAQITQFLKPEEEWDNDISDRAVYLIGCRMHHVGATESEEPGLFTYAIQEVLCILFGHRDTLLQSIRTSSVSCSAEEVYDGLVSAAVKMRKLVCDKQLAFWITGYEEDRLRLLQRMERSQLSPSTPDYEPAPHIEQKAYELACGLESQRTKLYELAQSGKMPPDLMRELDTFR